MAESSNGPVRLPHEVRAVNVGLPSFAEAVRAQGGEAIEVAWGIPAEGDPELVRLLTGLYAAEERYGPANAEVLRRLDSSAPSLVSVARAIDVVPGMDERTVLHPGPPLPWEAFCDPLRRSVRATIMAEGWASSPEEAERVVDGGGAVLRPANHHATVVPMATTLGPSAPVLVVEDPVGGRQAFSGINQGPGRTAWFGVETPEAVERLVFLREVVGPILDRALRASAPLDVFSLTAQGLLMGDDAHMRTQAATNLLIRNLLPALVDEPDPRRAEVARFLSGNHLFFLNVVMAAAKAATAWAAEVEGSSIVTAMARNGTTFGIRVGADERWFVAPAPSVGDALFHPGYGPDDAAPDIGDSAVLELVGLGGAAAAASPAVAAFVGGRIADAIARTMDIARICVGRSGRFALPLLDFQGAPLGVDVRRVVELGITPAINTGILHGWVGSGQVGAGVARAPIACFRQALLSLPR